MRDVRIALMVTLLAGSSLAPIQAQAQVTPDPVQPRFLPPPAPPPPPPPPPPVNLNAGTGITGGGNLSADRTISVDGTVVRTFGDQTIDGVKTFSNTARFGGWIESNNGAPTILLRDTDQRSSFIHQNSNHLHFLRGCGVNSTSWCQHNGLWPLVINLEDNHARFGGWMDVHGTVVIHGHARAWAYFHTSDERLKDEIVDLDPAEVGARLARLRPVSYRMIESGAPMMGLIAQEVQEVFPDIVQADEEGILSLDYTQLISPMLTVIQGLRSDLDAERARSEGLAEALQQMSARLDALEARISD